MFTVKPIGYVRPDRSDPEDDFWGGFSATIVLNEQFDADALSGLKDFSHAEILYLFHQVDVAKIAYGARHPRNNTHWPKVGLVAQRGKNRPNRIGSTIVRVPGVEGCELQVAELDAIDATPVLDIKPVMQEFLPRGPIRQPAWSRELMTSYWKVKSAE